MKERWIYFGEQRSHEGGGGHCYGVKFHPLYNIFAVCGKSNGVCFVSLFEATENGTFELVSTYRDEDRENEDFYCLSMSLDNLLCVAGVAGIGKVIDISTSTLQYVCKGHGGAINECEFSPVDKYLMATASQDWSVRLWRKDTCLQVLTGHKRDVLSVRFHPSGSLLLSSSMDTSVRVWDVETGEEVGVADALHRGYVDSVYYTGEDLIVSRAAKCMPNDRDRLIVVWKFVDPGTKLPVKSKKVPNVVFVMKDRTTDVWFMRMTVHSQSGRIAAPHMNGSIHLFSVPRLTGNPNVLHPAGSLCPIRQVSFNRDATVLAAASDNATVHLWLRSLLDNDE